MNAVHAINYSATSYCKNAVIAPLIRSKPTMHCFSYLKCYNKRDQASYIYLAISECITINLKKIPSLDVYDHTTLKAPVLVRSLTLSSVGRG